MSTRAYHTFRQQLLAQGCTACRLAKGRTQIVVDRGNPSARVVLIGEAPGATEDLHGQAFIGRAGRLLDQLFHDAGISTNDDTLIINVVKCRPPSNRAPRRDEVDACRPILTEQLEAVNPSVLVLLGFTAVKHLAPEHARTPMQQLVGRRIKQTVCPEATCLVLYHPAYLLYDPRKRQEMTRHIVRLRRLLVKDGLIPDRTRRAVFV